MVVLTTQLEVGHHYGYLRAGDDEDDEDEEEKTKEIVKLIFPNSLRSDGVTRWGALKVSRICCLFF